MVNSAGTLRARLQNYAAKDDVLDGFNKVIDRLADTKIDLGDRHSNMRVELLRRSFELWLGHILAIAAILVCRFAELT